MKVGERTCLICDCGGSAPVDPAALTRAFGGGMAEVARRLCRSERLTQEGPLLVACAGDCAELRDLAAERDDLALAAIGARAAWSDEAAAAAPKIAALLAEAALPRLDAPSLALASQGNTLVLGRDERAIEAARRLSHSLDVTVLLDGAAEVLPPVEAGFAVLQGRVRTAAGHLGAFDLVLDELALPEPGARAVLRFGPPRDGVAWACDLVLDLRGDTPLFAGDHKRDGYLRADPGSPVAVLEAILEASGLVGAFEKPRYIDFNADLCAHSRNKRTGCTRCLDVCPTGAITPDGDHVTIDPFICAGCGNCHAVCPTGAATYAEPRPFAQLDRVRVLLTTYRRAGGADPVLLVHDARHGAPIIELLARLGDGLPARVIPIAVEEVTALGVEFFATAIACGAAEVRVLATARSRADLAAQEGVLGMTGAILGGLGFESDRCAILRTDDPEELGRALRALPSRRATRAPQETVPFGDKRGLMVQGLRLLHAAAPAPADRVALEPGAPFGRIEVDTEACTLCFSCFNVCPTGAIGENPERPQLSFLEEACVQCGLCANTCPEDAITLRPQIDFTERARTREVLNEEEPALCIRCGKAFGVQSTIDAIVARLAGKHWMYQGPDSPIDRLRMCADCRVMAHAERRIDPYAGPRRPVPVTTADYKK